MGRLNQGTAEAAGRQREGEREPRVVIVADNASARFGGEAILPLHYFRRLRARGVEAWLVVHQRVWGELSELLPAEELERIRTVPDLPLHRVFHWGAGRLPDRVAAVLTGSLSIGLTQWLQRSLVRELVREQRINVVHVPTPVSPMMPSLIHDVGAPVVFGPMNGGMSFPPGFRRPHSGVEMAIVRGARTVAGVANRVLPGKRRAAALLVANRRTSAALPRGVCGNVIELVENGVDLSLFSPRPRPARSRPRVRFVFLGRLVSWKGVDLLLDAFARAREQVALELHVIGQGKEREALQAKVRALRLEEDVVFHGFVPQDRCALLLADADALVLPSLFESGGAVVLEAMASGLPVVATRWGGPTDYLDDATGLLVDPTNPEAFVAGLSEALVRLSKSPELRAQLSRRALERVRERYDWEHKIDRVLEVYGDLLGPVSVASPMRNPASPDAARTLGQNCFARLSRWSASISPGAGRGNAEYFRSARAGGKRRAPAREPCE